MTRADVCVLAIAELFRGDGEIVCNPIGPLAKLGGKVARALWEPDLLMIDQDALFVDAEGNVEGWNPYRRMFDVVWSGRRHVVMGASQIDRFGNQNLSALGSDPQRPRTQLIGMRGSPGNTINHVTSYWVSRHSARVFVPSVDVVCGVGSDRAARLDPVSRRDHQIRAVVTNLAVLDLGGADGTMRLVSLHPGVTVEEVVAATGFELSIPAEVALTREPTEAEQGIIDSLDPAGERFAEVPR